MNDLITNNLLTLITDAFKRLITMTIDTIGGGDTLSTILSFPTWSTPTFFRLDAHSLI